MASDSLKKSSNGAQRKNRHPLLKNCAKVCFCVVVRFVGRVGIHGPHSEVGRQEPKYGHVMAPFDHASPYREISTL